MTVHDPSPSIASGAGPSQRANDTTHWTVEATAGIAGALASLASVLTLGLITYAALGPEAGATGIPAAFIATVIGGTLFALLARGPMPAGGPSSAPTLILAALVVQVVADPTFRPDRATDVAALLALCAAAVVCMGVMQIGLAAGGLTHLAKYVPQPVLAGFMNGVAVLFVTSQIPTLLGWTAGTWSALHWQAFAHVQPAALCVGLFTAGVIVGWPFVFGRPGAPAPLRKLPPALGGLVVGCLAYALVAHLWPGLRLGGTVGEVPRAWPTLDGLAPWLADAWYANGDSLLRRHAMAAMTTAALMALIGALDVVLNGLALDQVLATRTAPRRELMALGAANVLSGALGGLPLQLIRARALATLRAGGRTRARCTPATSCSRCSRSSVRRCGTAAESGAGRHHGLRRRAAVRRVVALREAMAVRAPLDGRAFRPGDRVDRVRRERRVGLRGGRRDRRGARGGGVRAQHESLAGPRPARRHRCAFAPHLRGRARDRAAAAATVDRDPRARGALFFGSADRLVHETDACGPTCRAVVMDFHRVGLIDASGAMVLSLVHHRLRERGIALLLSGIGIDDGHGRALSEFVGDALPTDHWYPDADRAVEAAEVDALRRATGGSVAAAVPLQRSSLMVGLDAGQCERVARRLVVQRLAPGERLFDQGDAGDRLYVLTEGSISVLGNAVAGDRTGHRVRFVTCSPGMMLGEIAMLDHRGRSAEAVADIDSVVHALDDAALHALWVEEPALAALVYRNIAVHLSTRLRIASNISGCTPGRQLTGGTLADARRPFRDAGPRGRFAPLPGDERIEALDVVRGFALFGIFLMNIEFFNRPIASINEGMPRGLTGLDLFASWFVALLRAGQVLDDLLDAVRDGLRGHAGARRARRPAVHEGLPAPHRRARRLRRGPLHLSLGGRHPVQLRGRGARAADRAVRQSAVHRRRLRVLSGSARSPAPTSSSRRRRARDVRAARAVPAQRATRTAARRLVAGLQLPPAAGRRAAVGRAAVLWALPDGPIAPRVPLTVLGPPLVITGWLSWRYHAPAAKRSVRMAVGLYVFGGVVATGVGVVDTSRPTHSPCWPRPRRGSAAMPAPRAAPRAERATKPGSTARSS